VTKPVPARSLAKAADSSGGIAAKVEIVGIVVIAATGSSATDGDIAGIVAEDVAAVVGVGVAVASAVGVVAASAVVVAATAVPSERCQEWAVAPSSRRRMHR
jgi:hypothetical protein